uniref:Uncharacterized protein n=1 Tax=Amphora coffeiformis TaxID=265554 RepID=A0A7S3LHG3_9STRA|mmetsp:Transcript_18139/g.34420  ORF Transcript_18139/g.34420 Transcript_18139/m.34420 type:complete len:176 (+) Transcript_18139:12-539(+)
MFPVYPLTIQSPSYSTMKAMARQFSLFVLLLLSLSLSIGAAFAPIIAPRLASTVLLAQISQQEAQKGIDKVVAALRKDSEANKELGKLDKVTTVLGYGSPVAGSIAVRFNASFRKGGMGLSAVPLPFGLGQSNESEGRGTMVGQVKASVDSKTGKVTSCSVFRDLGYGRAFNLKV